MSKMKTAKSLRKPPPIVATNANSRNADSDVQFELELCWCVQRLESSLNSGKLNQKIADDTAKNLKTLKSSTAPLIKKRQVMKAALGDYRSKMKEEEKKMTLAAKQIKFTATADMNKKSSFVKKSAILTTGKDFQFNFNAPADDKPEVTTEARPSDSTDSSEAFINKDLKLTFGSGFKFNFAVEEMNENLNFSDLSIKS